MRNRSMVSAFVMAALVAVAMPAMAGFADQAQAPPDEVYLYNQNGNDNIYISGRLDNTKASGMWDATAVATAGDVAATNDSEISTTTGTTGLNDINDDGSGTQAILGDGSTYDLIGESGDGVTSHYGGENFTPIDDPAMTTMTALTGNGTNGVETRLLL